MDYHSDRFVDRSLIVLLDGTAVAVLPASQHGDAIVSHAGLSYAGLISTTDLRAEATLAAFETVISHYREHGNRKLVYKAIPHVFQRYPADEDLYALFRLGARLTRRDLSSVIELGKSPKYSKGRKWSIGRAEKAGVRIGRSDDLAEFHNMLQDRADELGRNLTHSAAELQLLASRFPQEIVLYEARADDELLAGVLIYDFGATVHTQYMGTSRIGRTLGALDFLLAGLIGKIYADRRYISFGISTVSDGQVLNEGLVAQKEGFGARAVVHDFYELAFE
jgi:hypothetical protein